MTAKILHHSQYLMRSERESRAVRGARFLFHLPHSLDDATEDKVREAEAGECALIHRLTQSAQTY